MGGKASTPAAPRPEPPAPFALPCLPNEFISGDALFLTEDYIPYPYILEHKCIVVQIVSVTDGDTFRGRHIPSGHKLYPFPLVKKHQRTELFAHCQPWTGKLKGETLRLRIYAVDAPESAKMGRPGQPFSEEATQFMKQKLLNRIVFVRLLAKDQYGRLIVQVLVPCSSLGKQASLKSINSMRSLKSRRGFPWSLLRCCTGGDSSRVLTKKERGQWCEDVSQSLLLAGLATIYTGQNAQYNGNLDRLEALLREACDKKMGMFSPESPPPESPASFKRRLRGELLDHPSAENVTLATPEEESVARTRGRSPARGNRTQKASASPPYGTNPEAARKEVPGSERGVETEGMEMQRGRGKGRQRRRRKSRSRSARRRKAAGRAAAAGAGAPASEDPATGGGALVPTASTSAQNASLVPAIKASIQKSNTGNRKGLRVRGISGEGDAARPIRTNTLTFSVNESPAMTGSRRGSTNADQKASASMSTNSLRSPRGVRLASSEAHPYQPVKAPPVVELEELEATETEESESEYDGAEEGEEPGSEVEG